MTQLKTVMKTESRPEGGGREGRERGGERVEMVIAEHTAMSIQLYE